MKRTGKYKIKGVGFQLSIWYLILLAIVSLFASFLANDKPLYVKVGSVHHFPALTDSPYYNQDLLFTDLKEIASDTIIVIMPPVPYAPGASDIENSGYKSPGQTQFKDDRGTRKMLQGWERHHWGTGKRGEDILAGIIHGTRVSLSAGIYCMLIAGFIGVLLGAIAGYFGDHGIKLKRGTAITMTIGVIPAWFYAFNLRTWMLANEMQASTGTAALQIVASVAIFLLVIVLFSAPGMLLSLLPFFKERVRFPVDTLVSRTVDVINSLPKLIIIIALAAVSRPSMANLILLIGLTYWTDIARITRAELMRIRSTNFIEQAKSTGASSWRILFRHALPNVFPVISVALVSCMASAILVESSLSFLGVGVPSEIVTWGSLLAGAREQFNAWWLVVFPGLLVFLTLLSLNKISDTLSTIHRGY
ncbi:MAG: ABC transporter permease [Bacteroidota bacterium]